MVFRGIPALLIGVGVALILTTAVGTYALHTEYHTGLVLLTIGQGILLALALFHVWRGQPGAAFSARRTLFFILAVAVVLRAMPLFSLPHSTDIYRYVWDGRVQNAGINPYRYIPEEPELAHLRDPFIFEGINRKEYLRTMYPPGAQVVFAAAANVSDTLIFMKAVMVLFEALAIWAVLALLAARGLPSALVLGFAWHPLAVWEVAGSGHIDIVAVSLMMLAILATDRGRQGMAGALLAFAFCTKFFPIVLAPALWRRWDWKMPAAFLATVAGLYLLYASAGDLVFSSLEIYSREEGMGSGVGLLLSSVIWQMGYVNAAMPIFIVCAVAVLGTLAWRATFRSEPGKPDLRAAFLLVAAFTVLVSPHHAWYLLWLVPFLCFFQSAAVLYLTIAAAALYRVGWPPNLVGAALIYVPFFLLLIVENSRLFSGEGRGERLPV
jgi:alpha-1,6-mannosyltransferase